MQTKMLKSSKKSLKQQYDGKTIIKLCQKLKLSEIQQFILKDIELEYLKTLTPKYYLQLDSISTAVKYSPQNPNVLVSTDHTGLGYFIDVNQTQNQQQNTVQELKVKKKAYFNTATIFDLDWHDQSKKIIIGSGDQRCQVIDVESCKTLTENIVHSQSVRRVKSCQFNQTRQVISPCEKYILSGSKDFNLYLWQIQDKKTDIFQQKLQNLKIDETDIEKSSFGFQPFAKFEGIQQGEINCVDWTQNYQNFIASVGDDKLLYLWDYSTLNQEHL
ncbi:WD40-repeat-containing domain [Pseudocohnilembus persalinus]|uniref:WD40-repeat-containing domain n=1 Tax=Pseudocohnilembus persalinus TaxID=266149 RepID=A0A0V0R671_PSEPJ|nr:WD40-repeat-containing domain [Pseudocohnilembus persalinus]|eukprot:KRX10006.1 WD40-repeat-containing domain [Pseudocohnilembus persalinus]